MALTASVKDFTAVGVVAAVGSSFTFRPLLVDPAVVTRAPWSVRVGVEGTFTTQLPGGPVKITATANGWRSIDVAGYPDDVTLTELLTATNPDGSLKYVIDPATLQPLNPLPPSAAEILVQAGQARDDAQAVADGLPAAAEVAIAAEAESQLIPLVADAGTSAFNAGSSAAAALGHANDAEAAAAIAQAVVAPLPLSNGVDDAAAIQAVLDQASAGSKHVVGRPGETYFLNSPIVIASDTVLDMRGCFIKGNPLRNMVTNRSAIASRIVTDASTTGGSAVITSASASFTLADVGHAVGVIGAGPNSGLSTAPGSLYGTIVSITNPSTAVISSAATLTVTGAQLSVFPERDHDITLIGGDWDGGDKDAVYQSTDGHGMFFRRADNLTVSPDHVRNQGTIGKGGRYAISFGDVTRIEVSHIRFSAAGDGVHVQGPSSAISIHNLSGTTGDDLVSFTCVDGQSQPGSLLGDVEGDISSVSVWTLVAVNALRNLTVVSGMGANLTPRRVWDFHARDMLGTVLQESVRVVDYAGPCDFEGDITGVSAMPTTNGFAQVRIISTSGRSIKVRDVHWSRGGGAPTQGVVRLSGSFDNVLIDGLTMASTAASGTGVGIVVDAATIRSLIVSDMVAMGIPGSYSGINLRNASTVTTMMLSRIHHVATGNGLIISNAGCVIANLYASDGYMSAGTMFGSDTTTLQKIRISGWRMLSGALIILTGPADIFLSNLEIAANAGAIRANAVSALPVRIRGGGVSVTNGSLLSRTGTQPVSVVGVELAVDLSILTPANGDVAFNTNAALGCGTGPAVYSSAAAKWKGIYSGTTN